MTISTLVPNPRILQLEGFTSHRDSMVCGVESMSSAPYYLNNAH